MTSLLEYENLLNMKRYFVCSDIHSFFDEWMSSLSDAGFDINNDDHILIVLDDIFDRGPKPWETYQFIKSIPLSRRILRTIVNSFTKTNAIKDICILKKRNKLI